MSGYDPKRPRPGDADDPDGQAPVDALLEPVTPPADPPHADTGGPTIDGPDPGAPVEPIGDAEAAPPVAEVDLREPVTSANGRSAAAGRAAADSQVPVAPAPDGGTANRAVVVAALVAAAVGATVVVVVAARRRRA